MLTREISDDVNMAMVLCVVFFVVSDLFFEFNDLNVN